MNYTTPSAHDLLQKIAGDPAEMRSWRELLVLGSEQKDADSVQAYQLVLAALEQIWSQSRREARDRHDEVLRQQRATGQGDELPSLAVRTPDLTGPQKQSLIELARSPRAPELLERFARQLEEELDLPQAAYPIYQYMLSLHPEPAFEKKINDALERCQARLLRRKPGPADAGAGTLGIEHSTRPRPGGSPLFRHPDRPGHEVSRAEKLDDDAWAALQTKLEESVARVQERAAAMCETPPRPLRVPRSIAPTQWLDFVEDHITLLLATLDAQKIRIALPEPPAGPPPSDLPGRADFIEEILAEIEGALASLRRSPRAPSPQTDSIAVPLNADDIVTRIKKGSLLEAERGLRRMETQDEAHDQLGEIWFQLGLAYQNAGQARPALTAYERASELEPGNLQAWFNRGMVLHEQGNLRPAYDCYLRATRIDPGQPKAWCNLGIVQFQLGEIAASVDSLNHAVRLKPDYARAWDNLAGSLSALEQYDEAERCCHRAINFRPDSPEPHFKLGSIYVQRDRLAEAEVIFRRVLGWQPDYPRAGYYLALILARTQRLPEALAACEKAGGRGDDSGLPALAWNEIAYQLFEMDAFPEAALAYKNALMFAPENALLWLDAGSAHHQLGQVGAASEHYEKAIALDPTLARAWHNLATVREELGDKAGAQAAFEQAERLGTVKV